MTLLLVVQVALGGLPMELIYAPVAGGLLADRQTMDVGNFAHSELLLRSTGC